MSLTVLLGGARSGKSTLATQLASGANASVTVIATAEARDAEMAERIELHRGERPGSWQTVEEPLELEATLNRVPEDQVVVVDCISLWVANLLERGENAELRNAAAVEAARNRAATTIVVSNEVGLGVVPVSELGRRYRDVLGRANAQWVAAADEASLVVAGRMLRLQ